MSTENSQNQEQKIRRFQRSEMVQEIVSTKPSFIVQYGVFFFLFLILSLVIACWFIQYPDIVYANAKLTSINAPKPVIAKINGKLIKFFALEGEQTIKGNILGYIESTSNQGEVINLSARIDSFVIFLDKNNVEVFNSSLPYNYINLGELQLNYQIFFQSYQNFKNYLSDGFYLRKKVMLNKDFALLQRMHNNLLEQKDFNTQDLALSQSTFDANQSLKNDKVISDFDYRNESSKLINKKLTLPQINSGIISNEALQNEKRKEIMELENLVAQQKGIFSQSLNTFRSQIEDWKKKYLLVAPMNGKIALATFLQENQELKANQIICFINPENTQYFAEIYIPQTNFGKIKIGQEVLLKFPSYPFQEYGSIQGKIDFISNIYTDSGYLAKVILPQGLITNYKKQIQFRDGLIAHGEIITENMRLLQRFYYNIIKQVKR